MADAGLKIGVEGEREFKKALSGINEEMKLLGSEMKLVASEFDANDKSVKALKSQYNVMSSEVDTQRKKVDTLKDALAAASAEFGENDKRTQSWKKQLNQATAELNKMEGGLDDIRDELNDARMPSARFGEAIAGIKDKVSDFLKWPKRIGNELKTLSTPFQKAGSLALSFGKNLASAGKTAASFTLKGVKTAAVAGTAALTGLATAAISAANSTAAAGDKIDKESQKLNMSREAYQEWSYVLSQNGADIAQLGAGIDALVMKMNEAEKGSEDVGKMFGELGISMNTIKKATPEQAFEMVVRGLQKMDDETRKAAIAQELLGGAGSELLPLLNSTSNATEKLKKEAHDLGMIMSDEAVDASVKYTDQMDRMKRSVSTAFQTMAADILPSFGLILDGITGMANGQDEAGEKIVKGIKSLARKIEKILPEIVDMIAEILPVLVDSIVMITVELIPDLLKAVHKIISSIGTFLKENWSKIKDEGIGLMKELWSGIENGAGFLTEKLREWTSGLTSDFAENSRIFIKDATVTITQKIKEVIPRIIEIVVDIVPKLAKYLLEELPTLLSSILIIAGELTGTLLTALKDSWPAIKDAGLELVHGLWEGIKDAGMWLYNQLSGWASGIVGDIKEFFGIQSPSKVFAGIGGYLAEGLGVGFEKEMDAVSRQMRDAVPMSFDTSIDARLRTTAYGAERGAYMERGFARNGYPSQQTIVLQVGEREFGRIVVDASEKEYVRRDMKVVTR